MQPNNNQPNRPPSNNSGPKNQGGPRRGSGRPQGQGGKPPRKPQGQKGQPGQSINTSLTTSRGQAVRAQRRSQ
ncbi:MAG TPA: hypothetical protein VII55_00155, partial [Candidatus Saccharimonadales bacterium]